MKFLKNHQWKIILGILGLLCSIMSFLIPKGVSDTLYFGLAFQFRLFFVYFLMAIFHIALLEFLFFKHYYIRFFIVYITSLIIISLVFALLFPFSDVEVYSNNFIFHLFSMIFLQLFTTLIYIIYDRIKYKNEYDLYKNRKLLSEIKLLRQQLNPHFLFNTLNSIYLQCLQNSASAADMVTQLAQMLRYQLETTEMNLIELKKEIDFIESYIAFERRRLSKKVKLEVNIDIKNWNLMIPPNVLIVLIENCFKHGISNNQESHIQIDLEVVESQVLLKTSNYMIKTPNAESLGTGLSNLRQRLDFKYSDKYRLIIKQENSKFIANLELCL
ncbi:hypothetical protein AD998_11345 [bacterium 336/3]|nr:hypothetical protein AD998_11345 [bacterium 336/3]